MKRRYTPDNIQELKEDQIFVFGSNMNGNHSGGAARLAVEKFGAIMGQAEGLQGERLIRMLDSPDRTRGLGWRDMSNCLSQGVQGGWCGNKGRYMVYAC